MSVNSARIAATAFAHAAAKNDAWPANSFYTQYPLTGTNELSTMFPDSAKPAALFGGTWTEMYTNEEVFFKTAPSSADSSRSSGIQQDAIRNITGYAENTVENNGVAIGNNTTVFGGALYRYGSKRHYTFAGYVIEAVDFGFNASRAVPTDTTNHPKNRLVKIWRRTA